MGRLIDADALLERWKYRFDHSKSLEECIKTQPTAYDMDKVVEELEEEAKDTCMQADCSRYRACCYCRGVKNTIDIVRKGGVK